MYKIYDDGQEYGPVEEQELRDWILGRRVTGATLGFKEGLTDWIPLSDFIEFSDDFASLEIVAAPAKAQPPKTPAATKGTAKTAKAAAAPIEAVPERRSRVGRILVIGGAISIGLAAGWFLQSFLVPAPDPVQVPARALVKKTRGGAPAKVSAEKSSFTEVAKHLDTHGQLFMYLSTEQLGVMADQLFDEFSKMAAKQQPPTGVNPAPDAALKILRQAYRESGLMDISGVGLSSFAVEKGLYRNRLAAHHYPDNGAGHLWKLFGTNAHEMATLKWLPDDTAFACHTDLNARLAWGWIKALVQQSGDKALIEMFNQGITAPPIGPMLEELLGTVSEAGLAITLNPAKKIPFPVDGKVLEFPEPGLALFLKTQDEKLAQAIEPMLALGPLKPQKLTEAGTELTAMMPFPLPVPLQVTMFKADGYLVICSNLELARGILAVKGGTPGLVASEEFQRLSKGGTAGNQFQFISARLSQSLQQLQQSAAKGAPQNAISEMLSSLSGPKTPPFSHFGVLKITDEGLQLDSLSTSSGPHSFAIQAGIIPAAIAAGLVLPAVNSTRGNAEVAKCQNNMKQAGLAVLIFQEDNQKMPATWKEVAKELSSPALLLCPKDKQRPAATDWAAFAPVNATYQLVPVPGKLAPLSIVARCPIHNHTLHGDGSVRSLTPSPTRTGPPPFPPGIIIPPPIPVPVPPKK